MTGMVPSSLSFLENPMLVTNNNCNALYLEKIPKTKRKYYEGLFFSYN